MGKETPEDERKAPGMARGGGSSPVPPSAENHREDKEERKREKREGRGRDAPHQGKKESIKGNSHKVKDGSQKSKRKHSPSGESRAKDGSKREHKANGLLSPSSSSSSSSSKARSRSRSPDRRKREKTPSPPPTPTTLPDDRKREPRTAKHSGERDSSNRVRAHQRRRFGNSPRAPSEELFNGNDSYSESAMASVVEYTVDEFAEEGGQLERTPRGTPLRPTALLGLSLDDHLPTYEESDARPGTLVAPGQTRRTPHSAAYLRRAMAMNGHTDFDEDSDSDFDETTISTAFLTTEDSLDGSGSNSLATRSQSISAEAPEPNVRSNVFADKPNKRVHFANTSDMSATKPKHRSHSSQRRSSSKEERHRRPASDRDRRRKKSSSEKKTRSDRRSSGDKLRPRSRSPTASGTDDDGSSDADSVEEYLRMQQYHRSADPAERAQGRKYPRLSSETLQRSRLCKAFFEERYAHIFAELSEKGVYNPCQEKRDRLASETAAREVRENVKLSKQKERARRKLELEERRQLALQQKREARARLLSVDPQPQRGTSREERELPVVKAQASYDLDHAKDEFFDKVLREQAALVSETRAVQRADDDLQSSPGANRSESASLLKDGLAGAAGVSAVSPPVSRRLRSPPDVRNEHHVSPEDSKADEGSRRKHKITKGLVTKVLRPRRKGSKKSNRPPQNELNQAEDGPLDAVNTLLSALDPTETSDVAGPLTSVSRTVEHTNILSDDDMRRALLSKDELALLDAVGSPEISVPEQNDAVVEEDRHNVLEKRVQDAQEIYRKQADRLEEVADRAEELEKRITAGNRAPSKSLLSRVSAAAEEVDRVHESIRSGHVAKATEAMARTVALLNECGEGTERLEQGLHIFERRNTPQPSKTRFGQIHARLLTWALMWLSIAAAYLPFMPAKKTDPDSYVEEIAPVDRTIRSIANETNPLSLSGISDTSLPTPDNNLVKVLSASAVLRPVSDASDPAISRKLSKRGPSRRSVTRLSMDDLQKRRKDPPSELGRTQSLLADVFGPNAKKARESSRGKTNITVPVPSLSQDDKQLNTAAPLLEMQSKWGSFVQSQFDEISRLVDDEDGLVDSKGFATAPDANEAEECARMFNLSIEDAELLCLCRDSSSGVEVKDRSYRRERFDQCFVAQDLVTYLVSHLSVGRAEATEIALRWQERGAIYHVTRESEFEDAVLFFTFAKSSSGQ